MTYKATKQLEKSETFALMLEAFFESCDPEFEWDISLPYRYGDHPDYGGGLIQRDIEGVTLIGAIDLSRDECVDLFGQHFVSAVEDHALENQNEICKEEL